LHSKKIVYTIVFCIICLPLLAISAQPKYQKEEVCLKVTTDAKIKIKEFQKALKTRNSVLIKKSAIAIQTDPAALKEIKNQTLFIQKKFLDVSNRLKEEDVKNHDATDSTEVYCKRKSGDSNLNIAMENKNSIVEKYKKACHQGDGFACYDLAYLYERGNLVQKDDETANQLYLLACLLNNNACLAIATYFESQNNLEKAIYYFDQACETHGEVCNSLALWYEEGRHGLEKDLEKAKTYYKKACYLGKKESCKINFKFDNRSAAKHKKDK